MILPILDSTLSMCSVKILKGHWYITKLLLLACTKFIYWTLSRVEFSTSHLKL
jgi:hypothetical protein